MAGRRALTPPRESLRAVQSFTSGLANMRARSPGRASSLRLSGAEAEKAPLAASADDPPPGAAGGLAPPDTETHAEALFAAVDRDGSGLISFDEFQTWWLRRATTTGGSLNKSVMDDAKAKWDELDRDGSGDLDAAEFEGLITMLATSNWKEAYDRQRGRSYYYNTVTKETRWQETGGDEAVSEFLSQHGVSVQPAAKSTSITAIARTRQHASRLANSEAAQKARARARQKTEQMRNSEKFQKASAGAAEFRESAEVWKAEAKTRHRDKLIVAGLAFAAAILLAMLFMYEWVTYVPPIPPPAPAPRDTSTGGVGETGQIEALTHEWQWVRLNERYAHPVVFAGVVSTHEQHTTMDGGRTDAKDPAVPRVQNIQEGCPNWRGWCFEIRMQEPDCMQDGGVHLPGETMSWMVIDRGVYHLQSEGEALMQAGIVSASGAAFVTVLPAPFDDGVQPVVLTQIQTNRDSDFVKTRQQQAVGYSGGAFEVKLEQGYGDESHGQEEIGWFAIEPAAGTLGTRAFEAMTTVQVNHEAQTLNFQSNFSATPLIFANIGTFHGADSASVRSVTRERHSVAVQIHEDTCDDRSLAHTGESLTLLVIQSDSADTAVRAQRVNEPSTFCEASGTYFTFVDTGQFVSWSLAKRAADHYVIPTTQRPGLRSHLATIHSREEQECIVSVAETAVKELHEVAVGWIGATDAEWIPYWFDVMSAHHGSPLAGVESGTNTWTRVSIDTGVELPLTENEIQDCGSLGRVVGGDGKLGQNHFITKTYGAGSDDPLPYHTAVQIELDFIKIDSWDGESAYMWVMEPENPRVENPVWEDSFGGNAGVNKCGRSQDREQTIHIKTTVSRLECSMPSRPDWCKTVTLKFNSSLDQSPDDESYGIQNIIISLRDENHEWRWGGDDNSPLERPGLGWSPAASDAPPLGQPYSADLSPWYPGQPSGPTEHYVAAAWPHWDPGAWHDCESETQQVPPVWPRCFYGLHSQPRSDQPGIMFGPDVRDDVTMISHSTTQWPGDKRWGLTMVLDVITDDPAALVPPSGAEHLNIMHVGNERAETSPAVWIVPSDTGERKLHIRTSTNELAEFGCTTEDLNGADWDFGPPGQKPVLGRLDTDSKQALHLTVTVQFSNGVSTLYVYIDGHIASEDCNGRVAPGVILDYHRPLFVGGDPYFGGFKGEVSSICLHPDYLDLPTVMSLKDQEVTAARKGAHVEAAGSNARRIEELTDGRVLTNLAIPIRWDNLDRVFTHGTDSVDVAGSALQFPGGGEHSDVGRENDFAIEMTVRVMRLQNNQFRNVFHLGNDDRGFAHICMLDRRSMHLIIGVAQQGETDPRSLAAGCTSSAEIFLDEDVLIVYSFRGTDDLLNGTLFINGESDRGCSFLETEDSTADLRSKMYPNDLPPVTPLPSEHLHLILGDTIMSRHSIDVDGPGFYGDISRIVLHEQYLSAADVYLLYEPHCGKHLHGYYVESTIPPVVKATGGGGAIYDPDACEEECVTAKYLTILLLGLACPCCLFFAFVFYEKPPVLEVAPEMMPTMGGDDSAADSRKVDMSAIELDTMVAPASHKPPALTELRGPGEVGSAREPEPEPEPQPPPAEATSPSRTRPPPLAKVARTVRDAQRFTRSATPERTGDIVAPPRREAPKRTATPPRRAAPSLERIAAADPDRLSSPKRRVGGQLDFEDTELQNIAGFRAAFERGQAPGASLGEMQQSGQSFKIRTASPKRTTHT